MASTKSPRQPGTDEGSTGSHPVGDHKIAAQRQPNSMRTRAVTDHRSEEARRHSEEVQAAIDIAAGW